MKVTYLDHCGFMIVLPEKAILVFQYYRDPANALHKELKDNPGLPVIFFAGHHHAKPRNYKPDIFEIAQNHERVYVLSNDILPQTMPDTLRVAGMSAGDTLENLPGGIKVKAFGAEDHGVGFVVTTADGKTIYHSGLMEDKNPSESREAQKLDEHFKTYLDRVAAEYPSLDVAMFPIDPSEGGDYSCGAYHLLQAIDVKNFFPMQMGGKYEEACFAPSYRGDSKTTVHCLHNPGMSVEL